MPLLEAWPQLESHWPRAVRAAAAQRSLGMGFVRSLDGDAKFAAHTGGEAALDAAAAITALAAELASDFGGVDSGVGGTSGGGSGGGEVSAAAVG